MTSVGYHYVRESELRQATHGRELALATSGGQTPDGHVAHPWFFSGFVSYPTVVAHSLLLLARVARTRFYIPPGMMATILRAADPVVTSTEDGLRFEAFSACCGVYARLDIDHSALDASHTSAGVTNVDVNEPLRAALSGVRSSEPLHLDVGADELRITTFEGSTVEPKVELPKRWLKGFAESQALTAGMVEQFSLDATTARRFVHDLPTNSHTRSMTWATPALRGVRLASGPTPGAVCVSGPERLKVLTPLLAMSTRLRAFGPQVESHSGPVASAWVVDLPGARFVVALSPEKSRGFSGEGALLHDLVNASEEQTNLISALLSFDPRIEPSRLAADSGLDAAEVSAALAVLASSGQVGFDLASGGYFHRPLPLASGDVQQAHPRLAQAQAWVAQGAVTAESGGFVVTTARSRHRVTLGEVVDRCSCQWWRTHRGSRGPCTHVLAVRIQLSEGERR